MGIKIEETQEILSRPLYMKNVPQEIIDAHRMAIETMRKYQKIEHIVNDVPYLDKDEYKIASIKEIINGNDD